MTVEYEVKGRANLFLDQPLQVDPTGQHGGEQGQQVLLDPADGGGQGGDHRGQAHLLDDVLEGGRGVARDPAQGLRGQGTELSVTPRASARPVSVEGTRSFVTAFGLSELEMFNTLKNKTIIQLLMKTKVVLKH